MKEFGYNKGNLVAIIIFLVGLLAYIYWKHGEIAAWFIPIAFGAAFLYFVYPLAKVSIGNDTIKISYPYPFRKSLEIEHHNIDSYIPIKIKKGKKEILFMGQITPKGGKSHMLWSSGPKDFEELSRILEGSYPSIPNDTKGAEQGSAGNVG